MWRATSARLYLGVDRNSGDEPLEARGVAAHVESKVRKRFIIVLIWLEALKLQADLYRHGGQGVSLVPPHTRGSVSLGVSRK
jgi:hypothetical protein